MGINKSATIVPGHGTLFVADLNTEMPADWTDFTLTGTPPTDWVNIGHTSKDNQPKFTKDGGDKTVLDSWLSDGVEVIYASTNWGLTFGRLQLDEDGLDMAFGGNFDTDGGYIVPSSNPGLEKALVLFMTDGTGSLLFYMPNTSSALGDAPSIDATKFLELPMSSTILTADDAVIPAATSGLPGIMKVYKSDLVIAAPKIKTLSANSGAAGILIEIEGTGFTGVTGAAGVKFGATNASSYIYVDDPHIVAVVTGSSGSAPITVTTPAGTSATKAFTIS
jgi:hypothetical protein